MVVSETLFLSWYCKNTKLPSTQLHFQSTKATVSSELQFLRVPIGLQSSI